MKSVWIIQKLSPYSSISGELAVSLGAAVRMAKKEEPDAEWDRISNQGGGICGGEGYMLTGKRKMSHRYCQRELDHVCYRFIKRLLPQGERSE